MKSVGGKVFWIAIWLLFTGASVAGEWDRFIADHPNASGWDFMRASAPYAAQMVLGIVIFIVLVGLIGRVASPVARWAAPPRSPPPPEDAGPLYALRTHPLHVGVCVSLVGACLVTFVSWPSAAMVLICPTIGSWVLLARRMGLGPLEASAVPQNQART